MKCKVLSSVVLAALLSACGGSGDSCCDAVVSKGDSIAGSGTTVAPIAKITGLANPTTISVGESVTANGTTSTDDRDHGNVVAYEWTTDGQVSSNEASPTFTFNTPGSHEVCLVVTDNDNLKSQNVECRTVVVNGASNTKAPTAVIDLSDSEAPLKLFSDHEFSCANSHDNDNIGTGDEIVSCDWSIQSYRVDNGVEVPYRDCSAANVKTHSVMICGHVTRIRATLTVTDNDGETHSTTKEYTQFQK